MVESRVILNRGNQERERDLLPQIEMVVVVVVVVVMVMVMVMVMDEWQLLQDDWNS